MKSYILKSQRGFVVPLFAAFSSLLVILLLGWCIDLPTHQAAVVRNQFSSDVSNATGLLKFWDPPVIAPAANAIAAAANYGSFTESPGVFFRSVNRSVIGIPERIFTSGHGLAGAICENSFGGSASCDEDRADVVADFPNGIEPPINDPYFASQDDGGGIFNNLMLQYFNLLQNGTPIVDFRNGIVQYNNLTPYSYFSFISSSNRNVSTVSAIRLANTMVSIVIDPAMPMGFADSPADTGHYPSYRQIFSSDAAMNAPKDETFPLAAYRKIISTPPDGSALKPNDFFYPVLEGDPEGVDHSEWSSYGYHMFQEDGADFDVPFAWDPSGWKHLEQVNPDVFHSAFNFYSATCDSLPFFFYKSAAVNLIDRLARSSAFSSTTSVGVTGYMPRSTAPNQILNDAVVPIFPSEMPSGPTYEQFVLEKFYPLQVHNTSGDVYLHSKKSAAFRGWAYPNRFYDGTPNGELSRPELLYCSDYYRSGKNFVDGIEIKGPSLPDDFSYSTIDVDGFHHSTLNTQRRSSPVQAATHPHWYDDNFDRNNTDAAENFIPSLGLHQEGNNEAGSGETPRNLVGGLAMRLRDSRIRQLDFLDTTDGDPGLWERPPQPNPSAGDSDLTGFSYLPLAIEKACNRVKLGADNYNTDPSYGAVRPIQQTAVVVFGFQLASLTALSQLGKTTDDAIADFRTSMQSCLCGSPNTKVILALLPFDTESTQQVTRMRSEVLYQLESAHNAQCMGTPTNQCPDGEKQGAVFTLVYDWKSSRFGDYNLGPHDDAKAKIKAAKAFFMEAHETITKLLMQWVYAG